MATLEKKILQDFFFNTMFLKTEVLLTNRMNASFR